MEFKDERERLIAEQAVLGFRAVREAVAKTAWVSKPRLISKKNRRRPNR